MEWDIDVDADPKQHALQWEMEMNSAQRAADKATAEDEKMEMLIKLDAGTFITKRYSIGNFVYFLLLNWCLGFGFETERI